MCFFALQVDPDERCCYCLPPHDSFAHCSLCYTTPSVGVSVADDIMTVFIIAITVIIAVVAAVAAVAAVACVGNGADSAPDEQNDSSYC